MDTASRINEIERAWREAVRRAWQYERECDAPDAGWVCAYCESYNATDPNAEG